MAECEECEKGGGTSPQKKTTPVQRAFARIGLVLLIGCIIATLVCALTGQSGSLIMALLLCDMAIPMFLYLVQWVAKLIGANARDENAGNKK